MSDKENKSQIPLPPDYEINWSGIRWPNFALNDQTPEELVIAWLKTEMQKNPQLLIPQTKSDRRPSPGDPYK